MGFLYDLLHKDNNDQVERRSTVYNAVLLLLTIAVIRQCYSIVYNLYFHPLSRIPGPPSWIAFPILRKYLTMRGTAEFAIREMHEKYGEVVRVAPNEVYFLNPQAWKDIYGHGHTEFPKCFPEGFKMDPRRIVAANQSDHYRLRRAMLPAFSDKALQQQEPLIRTYVDLLIQRLRDFSDTGKNINMVRWYNLATFDLIADLTFGESLNGLNTGKTNVWLEGIEMIFKMAPIFTMIQASGLIGKLILLLLEPLMRKGEQEHFANAEKMAHGRLTARKQPDRGDFMDFFVRSREQSHDLSDDDIVVNSALLMIAGSDPGATLMSGLTYLLLKTPRVLAQVTKEVRDAFRSDEEMTFLETRSRLPYLSACVEEALRMYPPVACALPRYVPDGTPMEVCGHMIPPKMIVGVHHLSAYTSEVNFHKAREFCPERWLPDALTNPASPFYNDRREVHKPFNFGPRDCIGRTLAYHEVRLIIAKVLFNFDMRLDPSCDDWYNQRIFSFWEKPALQVYLNKRKLA